MEGLSQLVFQKVYLAHMLLILLLQFVVEMHLLFSQDFFKEFSEIMFFSKLGGRCKFAARGTGFSLEFWLF